MRDFIKKKGKLLVFLPGILILFSLLVSCKQRETDFDCKLVDNILDKDQLYRKSPQLRSRYFYALDSLIEIEGHANGLDDLRSLSDSKQEELRAKAREIADLLPKPNQQEVDSLWRLQEKIDMENSRLVMDIVKDIGLSGFDSLGMDCLKQALIVFVHTPDELKDEVKALVESEKDNMFEGQYNHIMWHLNGRNTPIMPAADKN